MPTVLLRKNSLECCKKQRGGWKWVFAQSKSMDCWLTSYNELLKRQDIPNPTEAQNILMACTNQCFKKTNQPTNHKKNQ